MFNLENGTFKEEHDSFLIVIEWLSVNKRIRFISCMFLWARTTKSEISGHHKETV